MVEHVFGRIHQKKGLRVRYGASDAFARSGLRRTWPVDSSDLTHAQHKCTEGLVDRDL